MSRLNAQQLREAREWVKDCEWREGYEPHEVDDLPARVIERGIEKHYDGGLTAFIRDSEPMQLAQRA
jgi:hypothetical protein